LRSLVFNRCSSFASTLITSSCSGVPRRTSKTLRTASNVKRSRFVIETVE
jgi:hypothetical protein